MGGAGAPGEDAIGPVGACGVVAIATAGATGVMPPLTSAKVPKMLAIIIEMSVFVFTPFNYPQMWEAVFIAFANLFVGLLFLPATFSGPNSRLK
jgi:hypothetical protein